MLFHRQLFSGINTQFTQIIASIIGSTIKDLLKPLLLWRNIASWVLFLELFCFSLPLKHVKCCICLVYGGLAWLMKHWSYFLQLFKNFQHSGLLLIEMLWWTFCGFHQHRITVFICIVVDLKYGFYPDQRSILCICQDCSGYFVSVEVLFWTIIQWKVNSGIYWLKMTAC